MLLAAARLKIKKIINLLIRISFSHVLVIFFSFLLCSLRLPKQLLAWVNKLNMKQLRFTLKLSNRITYLIISHFLYCTQSILLFLLLFSFYFYFSYQLSVPLRFIYLFTFISLPFTCVVIKAHQNRPRRNFNTNNFCFVEISWLA